MQKKITVGIFFGGISPEHEVSLVSAKGILSQIDHKLFHVKEFFIDKQGQIWTGTNVLEDLEKKRTNFKLANVTNLRRQIDVAFPILHGEGGEDGAIQGMFEMLGVPYVGCGVASSAICLDKALFNDLMEVHGVKQAKYTIVDFKVMDKKTCDNQLAYIEKTFTFPVFVKPARAGSSIGIYKVIKTSNLRESIQKANKVDSKIVVEESVEKIREIEVSVMGNTHKDIRASLPGRVIPGAEFYDYDDKYKNNLTRFEIPAKLPKVLLRKIQELAKTIYQIANCQGLARVDFFVTKNGKVFINEINTLPGFTPISMYPKLWEATGIPYQTLITTLIKMALKN